MYEALGSVADGRVHVDGNTAKVYSSSGNKYYDVSYDPDANAIMTNDSGSYWHGVLGYPAISFLMIKGVISYDSRVGELLSGVHWKDLNKKHKNDFQKAVDEVLSTKSEQEKTDIISCVEKAYGELKALDLNMLGPKKFPPKGY